MLLAPAVMVPFFMESSVFVRAHQPDTHDGRTPRGFVVCESRPHLSAPPTPCVRDRQWCVRACACILHLCTGPFSFVWVVACFLPANAVRKWPLCGAVSCGNGRSASRLDFDPREGIPHADYDGFPAMPVIGYVEKPATLQFRFREGFVRVDYFARVLVVSVNNYDGECLVPEAAAFVVDRCRRRLAHQPDPHQGFAQIVAFVTIVVAVASGFRLSRDRLASQVPRCEFGVESLVRPFLSARCCPGSGCCSCCARRLGTVVVVMVLRSCPGKPCGSVVAVVFRNGARAGTRGTRRRQAPPQFFSDPRLRSSLEENVHQVLDRPRPFGLVRQVAVRQKLENRAKGVLVRSHPGVALGPIDEVSQQRGYPRRGARIPRVGPGLDHAVVAHHAGTHVRVVRRKHLEEHAFGAFRFLRTAGVGQAVQHHAVGHHVGFGGEPPVPVPPLHRFQEREGAIGGLRGPGSGPRLEDVRQRDRGGRRRPASGGAAVHHL
mmetsp:Transcript_18767/g.38480  ORF Transcript_18767/g.38480 Transcript_18767/m.38480 type:complete len:490 (-) Transcript_18767:23-1492(-)